MNGEPVNLGGLCGNETRRPVSYFHSAPRSGRRSTLGRVGQILPTTAFCLLLSTSLALFVQSCKTLDDVFYGDHVPFPTEVDEDHRGAGFSVRSESDPYGSDVEFLLEVDSKPQGAEVLVDDVPTGERTPCQIAVSVRQKRSSLLRLVVVQRHIVCESSAATHLPCSNCARIDWGTPGSPPKVVFSEPENVWRVVRHDAGGDSIFDTGAPFPRLVLESAGRRTGRVGLVEGSQFPQESFLLGTPSECLYSFELLPPERQGNQGDAYPVSTTHTVTTKLPGYEDSSAPATAPDQDRVFLSMKWVPRLVSAPVLHVLVDPPSGTVKLEDGTAGMRQGESYEFRWSSYADEHGILYDDSSLAHVRQPLEETCVVEAEGFYPERVGVVVAADAESPTTVRVSLTRIKSIRQVGVKSFRDYFGPKEGGEYAADLMTTHLVGGGFAAIMERAQVDKFFHERGLQEEDLFDPDKRSEFALLGVDYVVLGTLRESEGTCRFSSRLVNTSTGQVVASSTAQGQLMEDAVRDLAADMILEISDCFRAMDEED